MSGLYTSLGRFLPGLLLCALLAVGAQVLAKLPYVPFTMADGRHPVDAILLAILLGVLVRSTVPLSRKFGPGLKYAVQGVLPVAIVLMGARLDFADILRVSAQALVISCVCVVVALALTLWLCARMGVGTKLGLLIGVGTAICGGTAIAAVAPVIEADERDTAFAVTAITLYGLVAVIAFPAIGTMLGLSQFDFGVWAGVGVHATPQVMAAGATYGAKAGEVALIVKLVRVLLLAPLVVGMGIWHGRTSPRPARPGVALPGLATLIPPFILGFLIIAFANTEHLLPDITLHLKESLLWPEHSISFAMSSVAASCSSFLVTLAMAGVGLGVDVRGFREVGFKALYVGAFATLVLSSLSLAMVYCLL